MPRSRARCTNDDASALIEFALLMPLLAFLVFGMIDIGRIYQVKSRLENMAREGGAYAQYNPTSVSGCSPTTASITDHAFNEDRGISTDPNFQSVVVRNMSTSTNITGCNTATTIAAGTRLRVTATYGFRPLTPFITAITGSVKLVSGSQNLVVQG